MNTNDTATTTNSNPADHGQKDGHVNAGIFPRAAITRHIKSGGLYVIVIGPDMLRLEATNEPGYGYRGVRVDGTVFGPMWARSQREMEDGRFGMLPDMQFSGVEYTAGDVPGSFVLPLDPLLRQTASSRYQAEVRKDGELICSWECTEYLMGRFTMAEFTEMIRATGTIDRPLAVELLADPSAPASARSVVDGAVTVRFIAQASARSLIARIG